MNTGVVRPQDADTRAVGAVIALIVAASAMAAGAWLGYQAWSLDSFRHGATAVVLLLAAPALAVAAVLSRNVAGTADEGSSPFELMERLQRLDQSLRAVQLARAHIYVGASYAVVLGICEATGLIASRELVLFYGAAIVIAAAGYLPWTSRQEARLREERATCRQLLGERKAARTLAID